MIDYFKELEILKKIKNYRKIMDRLSKQGSRIIIHNRELINFSSNDYLGLSNHPYLIKKVFSAIEKYGYGSSASRLLSGGTILSSKLEKAISKFKNTESALIFNTGYSANTGIIPALTNSETAIFSDELNHASIIDGCRLSKADKFIYIHKDISHLEKLIKDSNKKHKLIVTDSVFSMDGDIAPLKEIFEICKKYEALLYIDDAHATGVIGNGKGSLSHFNIKPEPWIIQMSTFSKALGSYGAFAAGADKIIKWLINTSRSLIYSTTLPPCIVAGNLAAIELISKDISLINKLWENRNKLYLALKNLGFDTMSSQTPIIPIKTGSVENTLKMSNYLYKKGIYAPAIRPPTVKEARIRFTVTSVHNDEDLEILIDALKKL